MKNHFLRQFLCLLFTIAMFLVSSCPTPLEISSETSSLEIIEHVTRRKKRAVITVGIVQNGQMSFTVYGENGKVLPNREYIYEIASITKVFTAQLFAKAMSEGKVNLNDTIDRFLDLPHKNYYPTIRRLLTHTSGYKMNYYNGTGSLIEATPNFEVIGGGVTKVMLLNTIGKINLQDRDYPFEYSNFGIAVAGLVLEKIYNEDYTSLMNKYLNDNLELFNTRVNNGSVNVSNSWAWSKGNPYIPAAALVSTITDLMKYAQMQIDELPSYVTLSHTKWAQINLPLDASGNDFDLKIDDMGLGWMMCSDYNLIYHIGNTGYTNSFLGFDKSNRIGVVVLVNMLGTQSRIIGTAILREFMGAK